LHQILVHGEQHAMMRLKSKLLSLNANKEVKVKVFSPRNCEELKIPFKADKLAKVVGKLASIHPLPAAEAGDAAAAAASTPGPDPTMLSGVLVQNDFKLSLMAPEDLREFAGLSTTAVVCRHHMAFPHASTASMDLLRWTLECSFGSVDDLPEARRQLAIDEAKGGAKGDDDAKGEDAKSGDVKGGDVKGGDVKGGDVKGENAKSEEPDGDVDMDDEEEEKPKSKTKGKSKSKTRAKAKGGKGKSARTKKAAQENEDGDHDMDAAAVVAAVGEEEGSDAVGAAVKTASATAAADADADDAAEAVEDTNPRLLAAWLVMGCIKVWCYRDGGLTLEWEGNQINDTLADAVISTLFTADTSPAAVKSAFRSVKGCLFVCFLLTDVVVGWAGSSSQHSHAHSHADTNGHASKAPSSPATDASTPQSRLDGVIAFLQDQFGIDSVSLIARPRPALDADADAQMMDDAADAKPGAADDQAAASPADGAKDADKDDNEAELARLAALGIPAPGIRIRVDDKADATVWLERLEVECGHKAFGDRVRAVLERALDMVDGTWEI
jgi:hypothetical protein